MKHQNTIRRAQQRRDDSEKAFRDSIRAANTDGASVRELAAFTKLSPTTVQKIISEA